MERTQNRIAVDFTNVGACVRCSGRLDDQNPYVSTLRNNKFKKNFLMQLHLTRYEYYSSYGSKTKINK